MYVLVANLGSTSFKYRLFDLTDERQLARGGIDRIGQPKSACFVEIAGRRVEDSREVADHAAAVSLCLEQLTHSEFGCLKSVDQVAGIGFKAVFAGTMSGIRLVDAPLLERMEELADIAPAHNPPYAKAMRQLSRAFPQIPLVAALETAFHESIPLENRTYAIPWEWHEKFGVRKWGFHGASHRYIGLRTAQLMGRGDLRLISCHLGGSNSLCAMRGGVSQMSTMGMSPQTGLPHNNRVGDFDPYALPVLMRATGKSLDVLLAELGNQAGLLGISGLSGDCRDLEEAAARGHARADLAMKVFTQDIKHKIGSLLTELGGADAIAFTGGIGENSARVRRESLSNMAWAGIVLDESVNATARTEGRVSTADSPVQVWIVPTNEELIVARQTAEVVRGLAG